MNGVQYASPVVAKGGVHGGTIKSASVREVKQMKKEGK